MSGQSNSGLRSGQATDPASERDEGPPACAAGEPVAAAGWATAEGNGVVQTPNIADEVRAFIRDNLLFGEELAFGDDESFLEEGIIDSTGILELVHFLEERYGFYIEDEELTPENLDSISRLVKYVGGKCGHPAVVK